MESALLFLDLPGGSQLGCDLGVYVVGEKFMGIKMIPDGLRLLCYDFGHGLKQGFYLVFPLHKNIIKFCPETEEMKLDFDSEQEKIKIEQMVRSGEIFAHLGAHNQAKQGLWDTLTSHITEETLSFVTIQPGKVIADPSFPVVPLLKKLVKQHQTNPDLAPYRSFLSTPSQITSLAFDHTPLLTHFIQTTFHNSTHKFIAVFQLAFTLALHLNSYEALTFWNDSLLLLAKSETLLKAIKYELIPILEAQKELGNDSQELGDLLETINGEENRVEEVEEEQQVVTHGKTQYLEELEASNATTEFDANFKQRRMSWMLSP